MPTRNIKLEQDEKEDQARLEALRAAIQAGDEGGTAEGDVFEEVRGYIQLETARTRNKYAQARKRAVARLRKGFDLHATPLPSRDELHQRQGQQMRKALMDLNKAASRNPSGHGPEDVERLVYESRAAKKERRTD